MIFKASCLERRRNPVVCLVSSSRFSFVKTSQSLFHLRNLKLNQNLINNVLFEWIAVQVHQRCPLYFGSPEEVDKVLSFLA